MNIVLIGYRCSGKTAVGRAVAAQLNRAFVDSDDLLEEKAGQPIERIVEERGWPFFRDLEKKVIQELSGRDGLVIATGGGVVIDEENIRYLKQKGFIIWLLAGADVLKDRMGGDQNEGRIRPSLTGQDPVEEIRMVLDRRAPLYEKAAHRKIDTGKLSVAETVAKIIGMIPRG